MENDKSIRVTWLDTDMLHDVLNEAAKICPSVLDANIEKLNSRNRRGTRRGNGDNR